MSLPMIGMIVMGLGGAVSVGLSVEVIKVWPQPPSIAPYFGWNVGMWWGLIVGSLVGLYVGFIADESHYDQQGEYK